MLTALLFLAVQPLDRADAANEAWTKCLFATSRAAHSEGQSLAEFRSTLSRSCLGEENAAKAALIPILVGRGQDRAAAEASVARTLLQGREAVVEAYSYGLQR